MSLFIVRISKLAKRLTHESEFGPEGFQADMYARDSSMLGVLYCSCCYRARVDAPHPSTACGGEHDAVEGRVVLEERAQRDVVADEVG